MILFFKMLEFGLVWLGVVLAAATERGLLDREELAGEFLAPLSSPQGRQGPERKGLYHEKENISFYEINRYFCNLPRFFLISLLQFRSRHIEDDIS